MPDIAKPRWINVVLAAAAILAVAIYPQRAAAQGGSIGISVYNPETSFKPDLSPRDMRVIGRVLALRPDELAAMNSLYEGYAGALKARSGAIRDLVGEALEHAEVMQDAKLISQASARVAEWEKEAEGLKKQFLEDLRGLLTREQEGRWSVVERELRRLKKVGGGRLSGESVDVIRLVEEVAPGAGDGKEMGDVLEQYALELDRLLIARERFTSENQERFEQLMESSPADAESLWKDALRCRTAVRDLNERTLRQAAALLGGDKGAELTKKYFEEANPRAVAPTRTEKYLRAATKSAVLSSAQREAVEGIVAEYDAKRVGLVSRAARAEADWEMEVLPRRLAAKLGRLPAGTDPDSWSGQSVLPEAHPLMVLRRERYELDREARRRVDALLSEEQRAGIVDDRSFWAQFQDWTPGGL